MRKKIIAAIMLTLLMCLTACAKRTGINPEATENESSSKEVTTQNTILKVYSDKNSNVGMQNGWISKILSKELGCQLDMVIDKAEADIIIWFNDDVFLGRDDSVEILEWSDELLDTYGTNIKKYLSEQTDYITDLCDGKRYGFVGMAATDDEAFDTPTLNWYMRYDLYNEVGQPDINSIDDYIEVLKSMQEAAGADDVYGISFYDMASRFDGNYKPTLIYPAETLMSAYYGSTCSEFEYYDAEEGVNKGILTEGSTYIETLKLLNKMYLAGVLDPESDTLTYDEWLKKAYDGKVLAAIATHDISEYNANTTEDKLMLSVVPKEAKPSVYAIPAISDTGMVYTINAQSNNKEDAMKLLNWLAEPDNMITVNYGPKGVCWDIDADGYYYLTEFGKECKQDINTLMPEEYGGESFMSGVITFNAPIWNELAVNPSSSHGENFNYKTWDLMQPSDVSEVESLWREQFGEKIVTNYIKNCCNYTLHQKSMEPVDKYDNETEAAISEVVSTRSWEAIFAANDAEFSIAIDAMRTEAVKAGYHE